MIIAKRIRYAIDCPALPGQSAALSWHSGYLQLDGRRTRLEFSTLCIRESFLPSIQRPRCHMYYFPDEGQAFVQGDLYLGQCSCNEEPVASANAATHRTSSLNDIDAQCGMMLSDRSLSPVKDLWAESLNIT